MSLLQAFRVNTPAVVSEVFDDEVVIIHLDSGSYYSLNGSGAVIWELVQRGANITDIIAGVAASYAMPSTTIESAVQQLIKELQQEALISFASSDIQASVPQGAKQEHVARTSQPFTPPQLHKYTDMQDLLLLDPIHDVDDTGWPKRQTV